MAISAKKKDAEAQVLLSGIPNRNKVIAEIDLPKSCLARHLGCWLTASLRSNRVCLASVRSLL